MMLLFQDMGDFLFESIFNHSVEKDLGDFSLVG
jgi:hypothetical protein